VRDLSTDFLQTTYLLKSGTLCHLPYNPFLQYKREGRKEIGMGFRFFRLSLAELLIEKEAQNGGQAVYRKVMQLAEGVENETAVHTALLLYKAQALRGLGFLDGALEVLSEAGKRKKDRSDELLKALRYERALVYEGLRQDRKARAEWEKLYAEDPDYEDVAAKLERTC